MAFMEPQVEFGQWYEVETTAGTDFIPADLVSLALEKDETICDDSEQWEEIANALRDYCEGTPQSVKLIEGWGARLSAPGYLDCTEWSVFATREQAEEYLKETYGEDEPTYEVIVGNIGTVYSGADHDKAQATFSEYVEQSKSGQGRAAGEPVTMFEDSEIKSEYQAE